ncbi:DUF397 domain-containing protein [Streptomyces sp. NPDC058195]|uniref:DUF397 domain-containing protein n=1 Tax=Streptomyces sp. NPDC058195 TaxID=3346375 RepID=UPI0036EFF11E
MTAPTAWQKSSFSGPEDHQNCVHVRLAATGDIELVESDRPGTIMATAPANFAAFVKGIKAGEFDHLVEGHQD